MRPIRPRLVTRSIISFDGAPRTPRSATFVDERPPLSGDWRPTQCTAGLEQPPELLRMGRADGRAHHEPPARMVLGPAPPLGYRRAELGQAGNDAAPCR